MRYTTQKLGGRANIAQSYGQTVVGVFNNNRGSSVAVDFNSQPIPLPRGNDPLFIVGNGNASTRSNAFEVSNNGHSIVYDVNGNGTNTNGTGGLYRPSNKGATYTDNIIYAWGDVNPNLIDPPPTNPNGVTVQGSFGVSSIARIAVGVYEVTLNITDPVSGISLNPSAVSITANIVLTDEEAQSPQCAFIFPSRVDGNMRFRLRLYYQQNCTPIDLPFMFKVTGRP
jgi:hypothetical protein